AGILQEAGSSGRMALDVATAVPLGALTAATEDEDVAAVVAARISGNPPDLNPGSSPTPHL
ncbi:unnamed protein product, partial [Cuscuta campestris]